MEVAFGPKTSGEYKLSGCIDVYLRDCLRWFLEAIWLQAKTYTISVKAKQMLATADLTTVAWARVLKDRMRLEAQRVVAQAARSTAGSRGQVNCKMGQLLQILFPDQLEQEIGLRPFCHFREEGLTERAGISSGAAQQRAIKRARTTEMSSGTVPASPLSSPVSTKGGTPQSERLLPEPSTIVRPVATHALAALQRWRQQVIGPGSVAQSTEALVQVAQYGASATAEGSEELLPVTQASMTDSVSVAATRFPWEEPTVELQADHFEACAKFL